MFKWLKELGESSDAPAGGAPIAELDISNKTLDVAHKQLFQAVSASYTLTKADWSKMLIVTAAATVTFPTAAAAYKGFNCKVYVAADVAVTIAGATGDQLVAFNDIAADSIAFSTSSEKAGACVELFCDGVKWYSVVSLGAETQTPTIAT